MIMLILLASWVLTGIMIYGYAAPRIREHKARKGMMDHVYTIHGELLPGYWDTKDVHYSAFAGAGVSSSGDYTAFYQPGTGRVISGFVATVGCSDAGSGVKIIHAHQLPGSDQADPFFATPRDKRRGTMRYVTDRNGRHYFISFTSD